jgi:UDP-N-acetylmuramoyl-tripeptide--D-alanyl-D-alanine ligase
MSVSLEKAMCFDEQFIMRALPEASIVSQSFPSEPLFSVDSRTINAGEIFVALKGAHTDGHLFISEVLRKGAAGILINRNQMHCLDAIDAAIRENSLIIAVDNTLQALKALAKTWREQFMFPVVGITGSVGKTSTKQVLAHIVTLNGNKFCVSHSNQNSLVGICLNIMRMRQWHEGALFEMGISNRGEMAVLADIVKPTVGVITMIGHAHMSGLGSLNDIAAEKREIFKYFKEDSIGIINGDQLILANIGYTHPVLKFGSKTTNQIQARKVRIGSDHIRFVLKIYRQKFDIVLQGNHEGAVFNALAATSIACMLNIPRDIIVKGIQVPVAVPGRFEHKKLSIGSGILIDDCYNANPESVKASLLAFEEIQTDAQKIAIIGDMLELGVDSPFWHRQVGRFLRKVSSLKHLILVGDLVKWTKEVMPAGITCDHVATWEEAVQALEQSLNRESIVLVKGSTQGHTSGLAKLVEHCSQPVVTVEHSMHMQTAKNVGATAS